MSCGFESVKKGHKENWSIVVRDTAGQPIDISAWGFRSVFKPLKSSLDTVDLEITISDPITELGTFSILMDFSELIVGEYYLWDFAYAPDGVNFTASQQTLKFLITEQVS